MFYKFTKVVIIALGGSVMFPDEIALKFLCKFKKIIEQEIKKTKRKFIIVTGGGRICRLYQQALSKIIPATYKQKDLIGIQTTKCNAHLLKLIFKDIADSQIFDEQHKIKKLQYPITIASGWKPGWSTDYVAIALAVDFKIPEVIILGKPDYVYDKDPKNYTDAKPFREILWKDYRKLIPAKWSPGAHAPVDPIGARLAQNQKIKTIIIGGKNLQNFKNLLNGKKFNGSLIK